MRLHFYDIFPESDLAMYHDYAYAIVHLYVAQENLLFRTSIYDVKHVLVGICSSCLASQL